MEFKKYKPKPPYYRVWPEFGSSGIWILDEPLQTSAGKMIEHSCLKLPKELCMDFNKWIEWHWNCQPDLQGDNFNWEAFDKEGYKLATQLKNYLDCETYVEYKNNPVPMMLRVMPDIGCCVWTYYKGDIIGGGLELPSDIQKRLDDWNDWYVERIDDFHWSHGKIPPHVNSESPPDSKEINEFIETGRNIATSLKEYMGAYANVYYVDDYKSTNKIKDHETLIE
ncbi:MAG: hypothetical protein OEY64_03520 [Nitrospinota bacterium]|nr:hypothetical protein [Nitrospinota bacterium]